MNNKKHLTKNMMDDLMYIPKQLLENNKRELFESVLRCITQSDPKDIIRHEYIVDEHTWIVYHSPTFKITLDVTDHHYHCFFNKLTGLNVRFGKTIDDDPNCCELGPEILDLEISVNGCVPVKGSENCKYCYKNNTNRQPFNMTFETFTKIIAKFPINLSQIAFGITGLQTNPDLPKMFEYCRQIGIIPNLTTVGADLNETTKDMICKYAGACAVSCYTGAKELCYSTIKELHSYAAEKYNRNLHVNMHIVVSKANLEHVREVLKDIADKKVEGLKSVVFLRIKPVGRAAKQDCTVPTEIYEELVNYCMEHEISFGFDSCSAMSVMNVLKKIGKPELCSSCECCESSLLSSYINVKGEYCSCSFVENRNDIIVPLNVLNYKTFTELWNSEAVKTVRQKTINCETSCPWYNLD